MPNQYDTPADKVKRQVSAALQRIRRERKLSVFDMAQLMYDAYASGKTPTLVRHAALTSYIYGNNAPKRAALMAMAEVFGVPPGDICDPELLDYPAARRATAAKLDAPKVQIRRSKYGLEVVRLVVDAYLPAKVGDAMATLLQEKLTQAVRLHNLKE